MNMDQTSDTFIKRVPRQGDYHEVLTLVEFTPAPCSSVQKTCVRSWSTAFDKAPIAYFVDDKNGFPLLCRASREAGEATPSHRDVREGGMEGA